MGEEKHKENEDGDNRPLPDDKKSSLSGKNKSFLTYLPTNPHDRATVNFSTLSKEEARDASCFILDDSGRHVLDDQGSPVRAKKWKPTNLSQQERYKRFTDATKSPGAEFKWLQSVLVSPEHLHVPQIQTGQPEKGGNFGAPIGAHGISPFRLGFAYGTSDETKRKRRILQEEKRRTRPKTLDGFMMMDACGCELPDEARKVDVSGLGLVGVVEEDLEYFVNLEALDAGDNRLLFRNFGMLPILEELRLPCNNLARIDPGTTGFRNLQRLDLSYNNLTPESLVSLEQLPKLCDLDLTCNGLASLPDGMSRLQSLQRLTLERNQLDNGGDVLQVLSVIPDLLELNLAYNYFTALEIDSMDVDRPFPSLKGLDLAFNYVGREDDVMSVVMLPRLERLILYGNPLAGPTGEDPLGLCVEKLVEEANRVCQSWATRPVEVITEMPTKDARKKKLSNRRPYSDTGITMVQEKTLPQASTFRVAGNEIIFRFEPRGNNTQSLNPRPSLPVVEDCVQRGKSKRPQEKGPRSNGYTHRAPTEVDNTFLTGIDAGVEEMVGLELRGEDTTGDAVAAAEKKEEEAGGEAAGLEDLPREGANMSTRMLLVPPDMAAVQRDPVKLRMAFSALRYTLSHPVTSSKDIQEVGGRLFRQCDTELGISRPTAAHHARQLPRRPYQLRRLGAGGVGGDSRLLAGRKMDEVHEVLNSMGKSMNEMALERRAVDSTPEGHYTQPGMSSLVRMINSVMDEIEA